VFWRITGLALPSNPWYLLGDAIKGAAAQNLQVNENTFIETRQWLSFSETTRAACNIVINSGENRNGRAEYIDFNAFYNSPLYSTQTPHQSRNFPNADAAKNTSLCIGLMKWSNPTQICVPNASTGTESPHANLCQSGS
jgi:hypothetical protein